MQRHLASTASTSAAAACPPRAAAGPRRRTAPAGLRRPNAVVAASTVAQEQRSSSGSVSVKPLKSKEASAFSELRAAGSVRLAEGVCAGLGQHALGLFSRVPLEKGRVLVQVPRGLSITIDYSNGLTMPDAPWPRLREGAEAQEPLPWDLLQSLALLDGLSGDATGFWRGYTEALLPDPDRLAQPLCLTRERLQQLQHKALADGALEQQARLTKLFPEMMEPVDTDLPSWLQWAFACVRSRAFKVSDDSFAFIPFLDLANHSNRPNADFRLSPDGSAYELVAVAPITPGAEISISYSGVEGYTNQRWMAQYGFVPAGGNRADRIVFEPLPGGAAPLSLAKLEEVVGTTLFASAVQGGSGYMFAALKSLPVEDTDEEPQAAAAAAANATAQALLDQTVAMIQGCPTTLAQDEDALRSHKQGEDYRLHATLQYRVERKRLLEHVRLLLQAYLKHAVKA